MRVAALAVLSTPAAPEPVLVHVAGASESFR